MTDNEINEAIAEAIGKVYHRPTEEEKRSGSYYQYEPDFTKDLNAIQAVLIDQICGDADMESKFLKELNAVITSYADSEDVPVIFHWDMAVLCAPAWALCKTFLRTIGKWKE